MKKFITAAMALALLAALTGASAGEAGTASDPLITKEYADGDYTDALLARGEKSLDDALADLAEAADRIASGGGFTYTSGREAFVGEGAVTMGLGGSFILTAGAASVACDADAVIDTSTGLALPSGSALRPLVRYFVAGDRAVFTAAGGSAFFLDGPYSASGGVLRQYALYDDVLGNEWFSAVAKFSYENRLFYDWDAPLYRPEETATRAEMIYALWSAAGHPPADTVSPFTDLTGDWYVPAVNWAYGRGITNGSDAADLFDPNGSLSRQQLVTMLWRWSANMGLDVSGRADLSVFPDRASISDWAVDGVSWASHAGLVYGYEDQTFRPENNIARAEAATILQRFLPIAGDALG